MRFSKKSESPAQSTAQDDQIMRWKLNRTIYYFMSSWLIFTYFFWKKGKNGS